MNSVDHIITGILMLSNLEMNRLKHIVENIKDRTRKKERKEFDLKAPMMFYVIAK